MKPKKSLKTESGRLLGAGQPAKFLPLGTIFPYCYANGQVWKFTLTVLSCIARKYRRLINET